MIPTTSDKPVLINDSKDPEKNQLIFVGPLSSIVDYVAKSLNFTQVSPIMFEQ